MNTDIQFPDIKPLNVTRYARIISTGIGLPKNIVTNQQIIDRYNVIATARAVRFVLGIKERRWADTNQELTGLLAEAADQCLKRANLDIDKVDRVIYSKLVGDFQIPASSIGVLKKLGAKRGIPAFDISSACSGFLHAMDLAVRYIASGDDYVLILGGAVTARGHEYWEKADPQSVFLFGDAVAAALIGYSDAQHFLSSYIITNHSLYENAFIPCGTSLLNQEDKGYDYSIINMKTSDPNVILESSVHHCRIMAEKLLSSTGLTIDDIDYFITSDQSTRVWEAQLKDLGIPKEKSLSLFYKYGNTVAAMSPLILDELVQSGRLKRGDLVMMMAHGAGSSSGGMIFKF